MARELKPATMIDARAKALALWYTAPRECSLNDVALPVPGPEDCLVTTLWSGLSRGTERLVFEGRVPPSEQERMRAPFQEGDFPFPVKYGYCAVGRVDAGPSDLLGQIVFCLHPHQNRFIVPRQSLVPVPEAVPARRAILAANMETALNAHWDAGTGPADRIVVVGGGVLGLLAAWLGARLPGSEVTLVDVEPARAELARRLGFAFALPEAAPRDADLVFHASATAAGLATAVASAGTEARIIELSWYGEGAVPAALGCAFHARRLQLVSSQVGMVAPSRRARWDHARRARAAMALLADERLDALITEDIAFQDAPRRIPELLAPGAAGLTAAICYEARS
ncbi:Threonine dehydrogenase and related Zn-dependent dehydrogenases [Hyphomicrobiales bacterium]|nr:Threonine dehydrogenase and related Zn-dependent dehydrogenases [Hyphomicrobiales bacterium]CAH1699704.1 Threonine dehydrogenase and related Zn-dependent dehydrogenases [Hyphomicrobiales bacterium]CAI0343435.1 2-desacetyl-2-hydroxyethyl bacteriochlorophyllide A dehydrogenase [Hyphomicrobiales bacterium]